MNNYKNNKIAKFEKVSLDRFIRDFSDKFKDYSLSNIQEIYNSIKLPKRATIGSAGYDFYAPVTFKLKKEETIIIPTGIRCMIEDNWFLGIYPRSSLGFKYSLRLNNTVGIIDGDYFYSDNEGHILIKITNESPENKICTIEQGNSFVQGIFLPYGITIDDSSTDKRNGGFGSTNK